MSTPADRIANSTAITSVFGRWPSFQDAEVLRLELCRQFDGPFGPALVAEVHVFSMTSQVDHRGYFVCDNHSIVVLKFDGVADLEIDGFNHQNALSRLVISDVGTESLFEVRFEGAHGMDAKFKCRAIEVASVTPGIPPASVYARAKA